MATNQGSAIRQLRSFAPQLGATIGPAVDAVKKAFRSAHDCPCCGSNESSTPVPPPVPPPVP